MLRLLSACSFLLVITVADEASPWSSLTTSSHTAAAAAVTPCRFRCDYVQVAKLTASDGARGDQFAEPIAIYENTIVVGAYGHDGNSLDEGAVYVYEKKTATTANTTSNRWRYTETAKLTAPSDTDNDTAMLRRFGHAVAIWNDTIVVGATFDNGGGKRSGAAYIFTRNNHSSSSWNQGTKITPRDLQEEDRFGFAVAVHRDTVVVTSTFDTERGQDSGAAYVFQRTTNGEEWRQVTKLVASDGRQDQRFGWSVDIRENTIVVGTLNGAAAYVYRTDDGTNNRNYTQVAKLTPPVNNSRSSSRSDDDDDNRRPPPRHYTAFGGSVAIGGGGRTTTIVVVGAYLDSTHRPHDGAAYVYQQESSPDGPWSAGTKLVAADGAAYDRFGFSVAIDDEASTIVVGATGTIYNSAGMAYIFQNNNNNKAWNNNKDDDDSSSAGVSSSSSSSSYTQVAKITAKDPTIGDLFGASLAIDKSTIVVGAYGDDDNGNWSGSAYIFQGQYRIYFS